MMIYQAYLDRQENVNIIVKYCLLFKNHKIILLTNSNVDTYILLIIFYKQQK